jgi:hypothetical protein
VVGDDRAGRGRRRGRDREQRARDLGRRYNAAIMDVLLLILGTRLIGDGISGLG